jgi:plant 4,4-dimethylsterol C-4alpha-methyl-monooxygenase
MLPYATLAEAEAALGRAMTPAEALWFRYTADVPDYHLYCCNILFLFVVFTLAPLPVALLELRAPPAVAPYKLQPRVRLSRAEFVRCFKDVLRVFFLVIGPLQLVSYPAVKVRARFSRPPRSHSIGLVNLCNVLDNSWRFRVLGRILREITFLHYFCA